MRGTSDDRVEDAALAHCSERALIGYLVAAHIKGIELARELMIAQELADDLERAAGVAIDAAARQPDDGEAIDAAVSTSSAATHAAAAEMQATECWARHVENVERLVQAACVVQLPPSRNAPSRRPWRRARGRTIFEP